MEVNVEDLHRQVHGAEPQAIKYGNKFHLRRSRLTSQERVTKDSMTEYSAKFSHLKLSQSYENSASQDRSADEFGVRAHYVPRKLPSLNGIHKRPPWSSDQLSTTYKEPPPSEFKKERHKLDKKRSKCASHPPPKQELQISFASAADLHDILNEHISKSKSQPVPNAWVTPDVTPRESSVKNATLRSSLKSRDSSTNGRDDNTKKHLRFKIIEPWLKEISAALDTISTVNMPDYTTRLEHERETKLMLRDALSKLQGISEDKKQDPLEPLKTKKTKNKSKKRRFKLSNSLDCIPENISEQSESVSQSIESSSTMSLHTKSVMFSRDFLETLKENDSSESFRQPWSQRRRRRIVYHKPPRTLPPLELEHKGLQVLTNKQKARARIKMKPTRIKFLKEF